MGEIKPYKTVAKKSETEIIINKSRFIGRAFPIETEDEAKEILAGLKKQHYDATHNCFAYVILNGAARYSDDGEPGGTAGLPMMEVLTSRGLSNVLCVVTRYFGGVLLGAGGLVRAYSKSTAEAVAQAGEVLVTPGSVIKMEIAYDRYGALEGFIRENTCSFETEFLDKIYVTATVLRENTDKFTADVIEKSDGRVTPVLLGEEYIKVPIDRAK